MKIEKIQQAYGKVADLHIELFGTAEQVHADDLAFIDRHLSDREGKVLDLGCGPGHLTAYLHARAVDVSGIDPDPEFIAHARITHPDVDFRLGSIAGIRHAGIRYAGMRCHGTCRSRIARYMMNRQTVPFRNDAVTSVGWCMPR